MINRRIGIAALSILALAFVYTSVADAKSQSPVLRIVDVDVKINDPLAQKLKEEGFLIGMLYDALVLTKRFNVVKDERRDAKEEIIEYWEQTRSGLYDKEMELGGWKTAEFFCNGNLLQMDVLEEKRATYSVLKFTTVVQVFIKNPKTLEILFQDKAVFQQTKNSIELRGQVAYGIINDHAPIFREMLLASAAELSTKVQEHFFPHGLVVENVKKSGKMVSLTLSNDQNIEVGGSVNIYEAHVDKVLDKVVVGECLAATTLIRIGRLNSTAEIITVYSEKPIRKGYVAIANEN